MKTIRTLVFVGTIGMLLTGCNAQGNTLPGPVITASPISSPSSPSSTPVPFTPTTQTISLSANTPTTIAAPAAGGYTSSFTLPALTTAISAPVTTSSSPPNGLIAFSLYGPYAQSERSLTTKPSNASTLLYLALTPNAATTMKVGSNLGFTVTLPGKPTIANKYYVTFFDGMAWNTSIVPGAGTVSGNSVSWNNIILATDISLKAGVTYALAIYSLPTPSAVPSSSASPTTSQTPAPKPSVTAVTGQTVPKPAPVPSTVVAAKSLPAPTMTGTPTPALSLIDKKTQGAIAGALSGVKSVKSISRGSRAMSKSSSLFRRMLSGEFRQTKDTTSNCSGGLVEQITTNADSTTSIQDTTYADTACASVIATVSNFTYQLPDVNGTTTANGATTTYANDGSTITHYDLTNLTVYNSLANDGSYNAVSSVTHYTDPSNTIIASGIDYYASVVDTSGTSTNNNVSFTYDLADGYEIGSLYFSTQNAGTTDASGNVTSTVTGSSQLYNDPTYTMALATFPLPAGATTWQINGGTSVANTTQTQTSTVDSNGNLISNTQTTTDANNDVQVTFTSSGVGYTGNITQISTAAILGTISADQSGTGTVTYADGTKGVITQFAVGT